MRLQDLNFRHLLYFHTVITRGSVSEAAAAMHVSQPTVSTQLRALEEVLGGKLLRREGRGVTPTELGRLVARYADDIFSVGRELVQAVGDPAGGYASVVNVGIADVVPHLLTVHLLEPIVSLPDQHVRVRTGHPSELLADLAIHKLDVVISDAPTHEPVHHVRAFNHLLGASSITFLAAVPIAEALRDGFPASLDSAALILPTPNTVLRQSLEHWFDTLRIAPRVVAEFEDPKLLNAFGESGLGAFPIPTVVAEETIERYNVAPIGEVPEVEERFYAISTERRIKHPAVSALSSSARAEIFG